jgi:hypothetical protein
MCYSKIPLIALTILLGSCAAPHSDVMVFGTQTSLGVDISTSPEQANIPSFIVGYKRRELVWMPLFINGLDSNLLKYKHKGYYITGDNSSILIPAGNTAIVLSAGEFVVLPKETKVKLDDKTELTFSEGSTILLANDSADITLTTGSYSKVAGKSLIQDVSGTTYQGIDLHKAKYMAQSGNTENNNTDTYSVFASFGADIKGGKDGNGVGIAQYFVTGIAAQNLTKSAGADLVTLQTSDTKLNTVLEDKVKVLNKSNLELIKEKIGAEKALEISEKNKGKITTEDAKVVLIGNYFSNNDGSLNTVLLIAKVNSISDTDLPIVLKNRVKSRTTVDAITKNLKGSDFNAIDPLYSVINK